MHTGLDLLGFVPGLGAIPDLANAAIYAMEGDMVNAGISAVVEDHMEVQENLKSSLITHRLIAQAHLRKAKVLQSKWILATTSEHRVMDERVAQECFTEVS